LSVGQACTFVDAAIEKAAWLIAKRNW